MKFRHLLAILVWAAGPATTANAQWSSNGSTLYYNGGNVAVGITASQGPFQVYGGNAFLWGLNLGFGTSLAVVTTDASSKPMSFQIGGVEYARLHNNGNFGIGTNNPQNTLHVNGTLRADGSIYPYSSIQSMGDNTSFAWDAAGLLRMGFTKKLGFGPKLTYGAGYTFVISESSAADIGSANTFTDRMIIDPNGNVGIGTSSPQGKLSVNGNITALKLTVVPSMGADYVFEKGYRLPPLYFVGNYIRANHHLPGIASAAEMQKDGIDVGGQQVLLLKKIEELTLYLIRQDKELQALKEQNKQLGSQNEKLRSQESQLGSQDEKLRSQNARLDQLQQEIDGLKKAITAASH